MSKVVKKTLEGGITHTKVYWDDGTLNYEYYILNGKYHREDGPAFISYSSDGSVGSSGLSYEKYMLNGEHHREDGPAWIYYHRDGSTYEDYFLNGKYYSKEDYKLWKINKEADECIQELLEG